MKYLVVYNCYSGKYYKGQFTIIYDNYEKMIESIKENTISLKFYKAYAINKEIELKERSDK